MDEDHVKATRELDDDDGAPDRKRRKENVREEEEAKKEEDTEEMIDLEDFPTFKEYLSHNVDAVPVPDIGHEDTTYPPHIILDGASGVGKTQQAFALMKSGGKVVYILLCSADQKIYQDLNEVCLGFSEFRRLVAEFMQRQVQSTTIDPCSTENIRTALMQNELQDLLKWMAEAALRYDKEADMVYCGEGSAAVQKKTQGIPKFFENHIMLIDEAMPHVAQGTSEWQAAIDQLRFVRNFGRVLKMKVIPAGTSAVVSNMIEPFGDVNRHTSALPGSRKEPAALYCWAICHFLSQPMKKLPDDLLTAQAAFFG